ncbi:hypothetical protein BKA67DRAFT_532633 [Truncatella angustata]|uniref:Uncharacterized protein n=1 Tax=Truncatella angustata TaxID=152316 RepID=A0A9P9A0M4_9PEZI|nr:uncharacterized protein BKA67DRAFT_532633 [Truncatella angustata]KAH6657423.1 hypothetical protein BKA67DRAFT_532633 [Truncatella angustata]
MCPAIRKPEVARYMYRYYARGEFNLFRVTKDADGYVSSYASMGMRGASLSHRKYTQSSDKENMINVENEPMTRSNSHRNAGGLGVSDRRRSARAPYDHESPSKGISRRQQTDQAVWDRHTGRIATIALTPEATHYY